MKKNIFNNPLILEMLKLFLGIADLVLFVFSLIQFFKGHYDYATYLLLLSISTKLNFNKD